MKLSAIDLNLLVVLDAVLAERSVVRAAARLHVTPPAISNALNRLRDTLGDPIVTRAGRGIVPTPRALALQPVIARALREMDTALNGSAFDPLTASPLLTLAVADAGQLARLPKLAALLLRELPRATLRTVNVDTMVALGGLAGTEVDVAIGVSDPAAGIHREHIYDETSVVVARADHPRLRKRASKAQLASERFVEINVAFGKPSRVVEAGFRAAGITRSVAAIVPTFTAAAAMVAQTELLSAIPRSVVDALFHLELQVLATPVKPRPLPMHMSWHQRTHTDPAMVMFRASIERTFRAAKSLR
ncbi:MAG TPA: LysR family transcriptional regulator [Kofleriaceae bacterium]